MSTRKGRKRQERVVVEVEVEDENEDTAFLEKVKAPVKWGSMPTGFQIRDIKESEFETVQEFIRETYLTEDLLCANTNILDDELSVQDFLFYHMNILRDRCSICIVHTETERIAGVILLRVLHKSDFGKVFSRLRLTDGEAFKKIRKVYNYLNRKTDLYTTFDCESYLRVYLLAVHSDFRKKNLGLFLLRASVDVTRALNLPVLMGIFAKSCIQKKARKIGLETMLEIYYVDWVENGEIIFSDPGPGNYTLALMAGKVVRRKSSRTQSRYSKTRSKKDSKLLKKISIAIQKSENKLLKSVTNSKDLTNEDEPSKSVAKSKDLTNENEPSKSVTTSKDLANENEPSKSVTTSKDLANENEPSKSGTKSKDVTNENEPSKSVTKSKDVTNENGPSKSVTKSKDLANENEPSKSVTKSKDLANENEPSKSVTKPKDLTNENEPSKSVTKSKDLTNENV